MRFSSGAGTTPVWIQMWHSTYIWLYKYALIKKQGNLWELCNINTETTIQSLINKQNYSINMQIITSLGFATNYYSS